MFLPMLHWTQCPAVERVPEKVSGAWIFKTTRGPVRALFENLKGGATVNEFLTWFPGVTREQVEAVLHGGVGPRILTLCRKGAPLTASFSRRRQNSLNRQARDPRRRLWADYCARAQEILPGMPEFQRKAEHGRRSQRKR